MSRKNVDKAEMCLQESLASAGESGLHLAGPILQPVGQPRLGYFHCALPHNLHHVLSRPDLSSRTLPCVTWIRYNTL
jgi:hypothetical protein